MVASRENHVVRRTEEVDPISHGCLDVNSDENVGVMAKAWDPSSHLVGRRNKVDVEAAALRAAPASWWASRKETMFEDRLDIVARGAVDAGDRPPASHLQLGQRGLVVDLDLSRMSLRCTNVQDSAFICRHSVNAEAPFRVVLDYLR